MRRYETIYILRPNLGENEITKVIESTNQIITDVDGSIITLDRWGIRKLAYLIKKEAQGYYVFCDYAATPEAVSEIERKFRIDDSVLKYMTVKLADAISADEISEATAEAQAKKAAADKAEAEKEEAKEEAQAETEVVEESEAEAE